MRCTFSLAPALLALTLAGGAAGAADFQAGADALAKGDAARALAEWQPLAESGDARAQYGLGYLHHYGLGTAQDYAAAVKWYEKAAAQNDVNAMFALGLAHEMGQGAKTDYAAALQWYQRTVVKGHAEAEYALGRMHFRGRGVPRDPKAALDWFLKAAGRDHPAAQFMLGAIYETGWGVQPDRAEAWYWYSLAGRANPRLLRQYEPSFDAEIALKALKSEMLDHELQKAEERLKSKTASTEAKK